VVEGPEAKPHVADDVTIRHVLCPVDLSGAAAKALRYAAALSAELTVLFVDSVPTSLLKTWSRESSRRSAQQR
jgi:hypothetical protein